MLRPQQSQSQTLSVTVSTDTLATIRRSIHGCTNCSDNAQVPFAYLLERAAGYFIAEREFVLPEELECPSCLSAIDVESLIEVQRAMGAVARA